MKTIRNSLSTIQVWDRLLSAAGDYQEAEIYRTRLIQQFENRATQVKSFIVPFGIIDVIALSSNI